MPTLDAIFNDETHPLHGQAFQLVFAHLVNGVLVEDSAGDFRLTRAGEARNEELLLEAGVNAFDVDAVRDEWERRRSCMQRR